MTEILFESLPESVGPVLGLLFAIGVGVRLLRWIVSEVDELDNYLHGFREKLRLRSGPRSGR